MYYKSKAAKANDEKKKKNVKGCKGAFVTTEILF